MSVSDKECIALEKAQQEKIEAMLEKVKVKGLANGARMEAEQYKKSCEAKDLEIARLVAKNAEKRAVTEVPCRSCEECRGLSPSW